MFNDSSIYPIFLTGKLDKINLIKTFSKKNQISLIQSLPYLRVTIATQIPQINLKIAQI